MDTSMITGSNWAGLPEHLLDMVVEKLVLFADFARFSAVCVPWYYVAIENRKKFAKKLDRQVPMLLFPQVCDGVVYELKNLYSVTTKQMINVEVRVPFGTRYGGSSRGWLITVDEDCVVTLINPISPGAVITLPPILKDETVHYMQIIKAILSADPITDPYDYEVAAIYGELSQVAFIKPGRQDSDWTYTDYIRGTFDDIIYYKGRLHVTGKVTKVLCFDDKLSLPRELFPSPKKYFWDGKTYLVESLEGDLLLVWRKFDFFYDNPQYRKTVDFEVYKWNPNGPIWNKLNSLGGESLFLGDNMSTSIRASEFTGCCPNSIYFTHDYDNVLLFGDLGPLDSGVFNLKDSSIAPHYIIDEETLINMSEQPPIWFLPTFLSAMLLPIRTLGAKVEIEL